jgi:glycosyltransferase involved in cell wall biosynthesis
MARRIVLVHNTSRYLYMHYRQLIELLRSRGWDVVCAAPRDEAVARLESLGASWRELELSRRGMNPLSEVATFARLLGLFRRESPEVVLNFSIKPAIYGSIAARLAGCRRICSMITGLGYVFMPGGTRQRLLRAAVGWSYRLALGCNAKVFFQNPDDQRLFVEEGLVRAERTVVLPGTGIDTVEFTPPPQPAPRGRFLLVGRLLNDKGIREYVEAAQTVRASYPDAVFELLGPFDSNPAAVSRGQIEEWERSGAIDYLGEADDVRPALSRASVFVLPSYREGLPRATVEAMAMGRPVITTDAPGCRETVVDGENGFIVPVRDAKALAGAMLRFLSDPGLVESMGRRSREIACERYDVHRVNDLIARNLNPAGACE